MPKRRRQSLKSAPEGFLAAGQRAYRYSGGDSFADAVDGGDDCRPLIRPGDIRRAMEIARSFETNPVVRTGLMLAESFANYGFKLKADDPKKLRDWWAQNRYSVGRFVREMWHDWLLMDNSVSVWRTIKKDRRIIVFKPEVCRFNDVMGMERLWVTIDREGMDLTNIPERYRKGEIEVGDKEGEKEGEAFSVLKRERIGTGFAWPSITGIRDDVVIYNAMRVADRNWALASRLVIRFYKLGHEIRNGMLAGSPKHFWNPKRAKALRDFLECKKEGIFDYTANFDQSHEFPFPSADRWKAEKYEGSTGHIHQWLGVVGMLLSGRNQDYLMKLMRAWATHERECVEAHIVRSIQAFNPPAGIHPVWSNRIFTDDRLFLEMVKNLLAAGPMSQETALDAIGIGVEEERERKRSEAKLPKDVVMPIYDAAHGPPKPAATAGGRPNQEGNAR